MDEHKQAVLQKRIEKTMKALERNKMKPFYAKDKGEALQIVQSLLQPGQTITCGGSVTLSECGIIDLLKSGQYHYLDRDRPDLRRSDLTRQGGGEGKLTVYTTGDVAEYARRARQVGLERVAGVEFYPPMELNR